MESLPPHPLLLSTLHPLPCNIPLAIATRETKSETLTQSDYANPLLQIYLELSWGPWLNYSCCNVEVQHVAMSQYKSRSPLCDRGTVALVFISSTSLSIFLWINVKRVSRVLTWASWPCICSASPVAPPPSVVSTCC